MQVLDYSVNLAANSAIITQNIPFAFLANKNYVLKFKSKATSSQLPTFNIKLDAVTMHSGTIDMQNLTDWKDNTYTLNPTADRANLQINMTGGHTIQIGVLEIYRELPAPEIVIEEEKEAVILDKATKDRNNLKDEILLAVIAYKQKGGKETDLILPSENDTLDNLALGLAYIQNKINELK